MSDAATFGSEKLRGIEKSGKTYRVTISVGGVSKRVHKLSSLEKALECRDALDAEAKSIREQRHRSTSKIGTLHDASFRSMALSSTGSASVKKSDSWGITSRLVRGKVRYAARCWMEGKMQWCGTHDSLELAIAARNALKARKEHGEAASGGPLPPIAHTSIALGAQTEPVETPAERTPAAEAAGS